MSATPSYSSTPRWITIGILALFFAIFLGTVTYVTFTRRSSITGIDGGAIQQLRYKHVYESSTED